ncbi:MAG TPA: hypothetical protein VJ868_03870 [Actinomycetota bacterium]|nr:hypothetical protein [Actinomycetota bacterium]
MDDRPQNGEPEEERKEDTESPLTPGSDEAKKAESEEEAEDEVRQSIDDAFD